MRKIHTPLDKKTIASLKVGDEVLLSGTVYTARDQAHKRGLKINLKQAVLYYCGPTKGGSAGPTTSSRMDNFTPGLLRKGLRVMIGKGERSREVKKAIKKYQAVYFIAPAGCGALLGKCIKKKKIIAYPDLGPEAIHKFEVKDFPLMVAIDYKGRDIYER